MNDLYDPGAVRRRSCLLIVLLAAAVSLLGLSSCSGSLNSRTAPRAVDGVLDLRGWRFAEDGPVRLDGAWTFFWQQHLRTEAFLSPTPPQATGLITLPGTWNGYTIDGKKLEGFGFATYPLVILIDDPIGRLALKFQDMSTATAVYVNGKRLIVSGKPGTSPDNSTPHFIPQVR